MFTLPVLKYCSQYLIINHTLHNIAPLEANKVADVNLGLPSDFLFTFLDILETNAIILMKASKNLQPI
ncbi:Hypothetical predicted protein [Octopus vulgaris]|uniref:Uncharacterized protein n=1 Tax=Octopus vulgaris TaxID=6645 RepID=A0AA36AYQ4_OCTVU|nr:Hypothetical predicted protein [Octopus vulgaris]